MRKSLVAALLAGTAVVGAMWSNRRLVAQWRRNPDPLEGRPVSFPNGTVAYVDTDDGARIRTERAGDGPLVVLIHGLTSNRHDWGPVGERLVASGIGVLAIEQRGHGGSTVGADGFSAPRLGDDLAAVLRKLSLDDVVIGGHSMGGIAALSMLAAHPDLHDRIRAVALVATTPALADLRSRTALRLGSHDLTDLVVDRKASPRVSAGLSVFGAKPSLHMIDEALRQFGQCSDETRKRAPAGLVGYDVRDRLGSIDIPTTVFAGTRDLLTPLGGNRYLAEHLPNAEFVVFEGAGHMVLWERNAEIAEALTTLRLG